MFCVRAPQAGSGLSLTHDRAEVGVGAELHGQRAAGSPLRLPVGAERCRRWRWRRRSCGPSSDASIGLPAARFEPRRLAGAADVVAVGGFVAGGVTGADVVLDGRRGRLCLGEGEDVAGDGGDGRVVAVDGVAGDADVVGRRGPVEPDLAGAGLGQREVAGRGRGLGVAAGVRAVELELRELPGGPAGVRGDVQPDVPGGRRREGDGDRVVAGRREVVAGARDDGAERGAVRAALYGEGLGARAPARGELEDHLVDVDGRAEVGLEPLRERVVVALPVRVLVAVAGVARGVLTE